MEWDHSEALGFVAYDPTSDELSEVTKAMTDLLDDSKQAEGSAHTVAAGSTAAQALAAAGDAQQAQDVAALDDSAAAAQRRLG